MFIYFIHFMKCFSATYEELPNEYLEHEYEKISNENDEISSEYPENEYEEIYDFVPYADPKDIVKKTALKNVSIHYDTLPFYLYEALFDKSFQIILKDIINLYEKLDFKTVLKCENQSFNAKFKLFGIFKSLQTSLDSLRKIPIVTYKYIRYNRKVLAFWYGVFYLNTGESSLNYKFLPFSFQKQFLLENFILIDCFLHKSSLVCFYVEFLSNNYKISLDSNSNYLENVFQKIIFKDSDDTFLITERLCKLASYNFFIIFLSIFTHFQSKYLTSKDNHIIFDILALNEIIDIYYELEIYFRDLMNTNQLVCLNLGWNITYYLIDRNSASFATWFQDFNFASEKIVNYFQKEITNLPIHITEIIKSCLVTFNLYFTDVLNNPDKIKKIESLLYQSISLNFSQKYDEDSIILEVYLTYGMLLYTLDSMYISKTLNISNPNDIHWFCCINSIVNMYHDLKISVNIKFLSINKLHTLILVMFIRLKLNLDTILDFEYLIQNLIISLKMHGFDICSKLPKEKSEKLQNDSIFNNQFFPFYYTALVVLKKNTFDDFKVFLLNIHIMKDFLFLPLSLELESTNVVNFSKKNIGEISWGNYLNYLRRVSEYFRYLEQKHSN